MPSIVALLRPYSWIKNLFIFVPLFFAKDIFNVAKVDATIIAFVVFCLTASCVYIINDLVDIEQDQKHSQKKNRPVASGKVSRKQALTLLCCLAVAVLLLITFFIPQIWGVMLIYIALTFLYTFYFKHVAVVDILLIASFYLIRIVIGGIAASIYISEWLLLCTIFMSLFLIVGKRLSEFQQEHKRAVLEHYTPEFLKGLLILASTLAVISYSLYTVLVLSSPFAVFSVFFVLLGVIRYTLLIFTSNKSEYPEKLVVSDPILLLSGILWICFMYLIFYHHI